MTTRLLFGLGDDDTTNKGRSVSCQIFFSLGAATDLVLFFPLVKGFLLLLLLDLSTMCQRHGRFQKIRKNLATEVKIGFYSVIADEDVEGFCFASWQPRCSETS